MREGVPRAIVQGLLHYAIDRALEFGVEAFGARPEVEVRCHLEPVDSLRTSHERLERWDEAKVV